MYGAILSKKQVTFTVGIQEIELNMNVPAGLNLQLGMDEDGLTPFLYSSTTTNANIGYPFTLSSVANIVGSSAGDKSYPFFYNWQIEGTPQACNDGSRRPVTATVAPNITPTIAGLDPLYLHTDLPVSVTVTPQGGVLSGAGVVGNSFHPSLAGVGVHTLTYTYAMGNCIKNTSFETEVKFDSATIQYETLVQLYGNPGAQQRLYVVVNQATTVDIRLYNSIGQVVKSARYGANRGSNMFDLDLAAMAKGVYILEIKTDAISSRKVFKVVR